MAPLPTESSTASRTSTRLMPVTQTKTLNAKTSVLPPTEFHVERTGKTAVTPTHVRPTGTETSAIRESPLLDVLPLENAYYTSNHS